MRHERHLNGLAKSQKAAHPEKAPFPDGSGRGKPILFSGPMVRALLDGRKTQTRRVLKPKPNGDVIHYGMQSEGGAFWTDQQFESHRLRIWAGDRLWVRESGQLLREAYDHDPRHGEDVWRDAGFCHSADGEIIEARSYDPPLREWEEDCTRVNRPSTHMPRWASRLTLTVTDVRVQRLQDISEEDARAEGMDDATAQLVLSPEERHMLAYAHIATPHALSRIIFETVWEQINGASSWQTNPWVAAYTFTVERRNIDAALSKATGGQHV